MRTQGTKKSKKHAKAKKTTKTKKTKAASKLKLAEDKAKSMDYDQFNMAEAIALKDGTLLDDDG